MPSNTFFSPPEKIALVHEWFSPSSYGGAEKVVRAIDELLSLRGCNAELFGLVDGESNRSKSWLFRRKIQTSFIQNLPFGINHIQSYLPLLPFAIEQIDLSDYPLIISSSHLVAKGVLSSPDQLHVGYIHTPARYAWDQMPIYLKRSLLARLGFGPLIRYQLHCFRQWDQLSGARVDCLLANSRFTARRIYQYWGRKAEVIHPPVEVDRFRHDQPRGEFYLCLCRLVPNKRVDLVVEAFNQLQLPLVVVGDGPEKNFLKSLAAPNIKFLGIQDSKKVESLMESCRAFIYAGVEDFGIAPVEAMAAGSPVIAFGKGGLLDTVRCATRNSHGATGILFKEQTVKSLLDAVNWFEDSKLWKELSSESIRTWADGFRPEVFDDRFETALAKAWTAHHQSCADGLSDPVS